MGPRGPGRDAPPAPRALLRAPLLFHDAAQARPASLGDLCRALAPVRTGGVTAAGFGGRTSIEAALEEHGQRALAPLRGGLAGLRPGAGCGSRPLRRREPERDGRPRARAGGRTLHPGRTLRAQLRVLCRVIVREETARSTRPGRQRRRAWSGGGGACWAAQGAALSRAGTGRAATLREGRLRRRGRSRVQRRVRRIAPRHPPFQGERHGRGLLVLPLALASRG